MCLYPYRDTDGCTVMQLLQFLLFQSWCSPLQHTCLHWSRHQVTIHQTCTIAGLGFSCLASAYALALLAASAFPAASTIDPRLLRLPAAGLGGLCLLCAEHRVTPSDASLLRAGPPRVVLLTVLSVQQLTSSSNLTHTRTIHRQAMQ